MLQRWICVPFLIALLGTGSCGAPLTVVKSINDIYSNVALQAAEVRRCLDTCTRSDVAASGLMSSYDLQRALLARSTRGLNGVIANRYMMPFTQRVCTSSRVSVSLWAFPVGHCQGHSAANWRQGPQPARCSHGHTAVLYWQTASSSSRG